PPGEQDGTTLKLAMLPYTPDADSAIAFEPGELELAVDAYASGPDVKTLKLKRAAARMGGFSWDGEIKAEQLQVGAKLEPGSPERYPTSVNLAGRGLQGWDVKLESFSGHADLSKLEQPALRLLVKDQERWLKLNGSVDLTDDSSTLELSALWDPAYFFSLSFLADEKTKLPDFSCIEHPRWQAEVNFGPDFAFESINAILDFGKTRYESLDLTRVYTHAFATTKVLHLSDISLSTSRYTVGGSFQTNFDTDAYRFLLAGQIDPLDITFIIDESWWEPLWSDFNFHQKLPYANLDLRGFFGGGTRGKYFFGYNKLDDFSYRGVEVDSLTAMLWRSPLRMLIYGIDGKGRDGDFSGALQFDYKADGEDRVSLAFAVKSGLPVDQAVKVVGPDAVEYTEGVTTQAKPQIHVYGVTFGEDSPHPGDLYLNLTSSMDKETIYMDYVFDKVDFHLLKNPQRIDLPRVNFTMAEGQGSGSAVVSFINEEERELTLSANLKEAKYVYLQQAMPFLANKESMQQQTSAAPAGTDASAAGTTDSGKQAKEETSRRLQTALVDLRIDTQGMLGDMNTFRGYGSLGVKNAFLGQLHLFGGLSRATQSIGLSLGTVEFTKGQTPFLLGNGYLHFSDIEVSGPTARVKANGNLHMDDSALEFYVSLFPLGGIDFPVVSQLFSVLDPITNTLEAKLTGTVDDPVWNVEFRPIGIFTGQKTVPNPTGEKVPEPSS
ncbi:MAG: AsmA-like C-terminal region-containing protein, partial [Verrucomicrobiota bacterium]